MKKSFFAVALGVLSFLAFSESLTKEAVFSKLSERAETKGNFIQTKTISARNMTLKSSGKYSFSTSEITWATEKPFASTLTITEREMIQIAPNGQKSTMDFSSNPAFSSIAKTIKSLFNNDLAELEKNFTVDFKDTGEGGWEMNLKPKDRTVASAIKSIDIAGVFLQAQQPNGGEAGIKRMLIAESSGDKIQYDFN